MTTQTNPDTRHTIFAPLMGPGLSITLGSLGISSAAVTLPDLAQAFPNGRLDTTFVVTAYILAMTALIVPIGRAGDLFGKRIVLMGGLCLFATGALFAYTASTLPILIISRLIQGTGAAAMMAIPLAQLRDVVPIGEMGRWMGLMGALSAIGTASGPAIGGMILSTFDWRAVYVLQAPAAIIALALCLGFAAPEKSRSQRPDLDIAGAITLALFLAAFSFFMSDVAHGFDRTAGLTLGVAVASLIGFLKIEARVAAPIIPLDLLQSAHLRLSLLMNTMVSIVMLGILVVGPFYLTMGLGLSTAQMGLVMSAGPLSAFLSGVPAGWLTEKLGTQRALTLGAAVMTLASCAMAILPYLFGLWGFLLTFVILAPSFQLFLIGLQTSVMEKAPEADRGVTAGLINLSRSFGFVLGTSAISTIFWSLTRLQLGLATQADRITFAMAGTFILCAALGIGVLVLATNKLARP